MNVLIDGELLHENDVYTISCGKCRIMTRFHVRDETYAKEVLESHYIGCRQKQMRPSRYGDLTGLERPTCWRCGSRFQTVYALNRHVAMHGGKAQ